MDNIFEQDLHIQEVKKRYDQFLNTTIEKSILEKQTKENRLLYYSNYTKWKEQFSNVISNYKEKNISAIPSIAINRINNAINLFNTNGVTIVSQKNFNINNNSKNIIEHNNISNFYKKHGYDIFNAIETGQSKNNNIKNLNYDSDLSYSFEENKSAIPSKRLIDSFNNINKKNKLMVFDLETISGTDVNNKIKLSQITDFTFSLFDAKTKKVMKTYSAIIGATSEQYDDYLDIINKFRKTSGEVTNYEKVAFERLKLIGASEIDFSNIDKGIAKFTKFPTSKEVPGIDIDLAQKGADILKYIGEKQQKSKLVKYNDIKMYSWEKSLFEALDTVIDKNITIAGHNIQNFDIPMISETLYSKMHSDGAKAYVAKKYQNGFKPKYIADTLVAERLYGNDIPISESHIKAAKENDLTTRTQEALVRAFFPDFYEENGAHLSSVDVEANAKLILESGRYDTSGNNKNSIFPKGTNTKRIQIKDGSKQLFLAPKGMLPAAHNLIAFTKDFINNNYHTNDKFLITNNDVKDELFGQSALQKDIAYTIKSIHKINIDDVIKDDIRKINPSLYDNELYSVSFLPVINDTETTDIKSNTPITLLGTKNNIEKYISELRLVAEKDTNNKWSTENIPDENYKDLKRITVQNGSIIEDNIPKTYDGIQTILDQSTHAVLNESTARKIRDTQYSWNKKMIKLLDEIDKYVETNSDENTSDYEKRKLRNDFINKEIKKAQDIELKRNNGEAISSQEYGAFHKILGFHPLNDKNSYKVYSNTIHSSINAIDYFYANRDVIKTAIDFTENQDIDLKNTQELDSTFSYFYKGLMSKAELKKGPEAIGKINTALPYSDYQFEIDLNGYKGRTFDDNILKVDLNNPNAGYNLINNLFSKQGIKKISKITEESKVAELKRFQDFLFKNNKKIDSNFDNTEPSIRINKFNDYLRIDSSKDNLSTSIDKTIYNLKKIKEINPLSGIISDSVHYDVINPTYKNFGLSKEEIYSSALLLEKEKPNFKTNKDFPLQYHVNNIVDNIIFQKIADSPEQEIEEIANRTKFNKEQASALHRIRNIKREETKDLFNFLLGAVVDAGGEFKYDINNKTLHIKEKDNWIKIDDIFKDVITDSGMMYMQIGNTQTASPYGYYLLGYNETTKRLSANTRIAYAKDSIGWAKSKILEAATDPNSEETIASEFQRAIKKFNQVLRQASSNSKEDMQDMKMSSWFDVKGLWKTLPDMYQKGFLNNFKELETIPGTDKINNLSLKNIFHEFLEEYSNKEVDVDNLDNKYIVAINEYLPNIIQNGIVDDYIETHNLTNSTYLHANTADEYIKSNLVAVNKKSANAILSFNENYNYGEREGILSRGINNQIARAKSFNADYVEQQISSGELNDVQIGSPIETEHRSLQKTNKHGLTYKINDTVMARRLNVTTGDLRLILEHSDLDEKTMDFFSTITTNEGSSAITPQLASYAFSSRDSIQKININKLLEENGEFLQRLNERNNITPTLSIKDGKIVFNYSNGLFVQEGEQLAYIKGWQEAQDDVVSKRDGILKYGIFSSNSMLVDEKSIETLLNKGITKEQKDLLTNYLLESQNNKKDLNTSSIRAWNLFQQILKDNNFNSYLYVDSIDMSANIKIAQMKKEKGMAKVIAPSIGSLNTNIKNVIEELVGKGSSVEVKNGKIVKRYGADNILHLIPNRSIIDSIMTSDSIADSMFGKVLSGYNKDKKQLTDNEIIDSLKRNGFNDKTDFYNAILEEQNYYSNELNRVLKQAGITKNNEWINVIGHTNAEVLKHQDTDFARNAISQLLSEDNSIENKQKIVKELSNSVIGIHLDSNNNIVVPDSSYHNVEELNKAINKLLIDNNGKFVTDRVFYYNDKNMISEQEYNQLSDDEKKQYKSNINEVDFIPVRQLPNYDKERVKAVDDAYGKSTYLTDRHLEILSKRRYDDNTLNILHKRLIDEFGQNEGTKKYNKLYGNINNNDYIFKELISNLKNKRYMQDGDDLLVRFDDKGNKIAFYKNAEQNKQAKIIAKKAKDKLIEQGIDEKYINAFIDVARKRGARGVSSSYIEGNHTALRFSQAMNFNNNNKNFTLDFMKKDGFIVKSISDISTATDIDANLENSMYGKNLIIDLHMDELGNKQLYKNEAERYIAIPFANPKYTDKDYKIRESFQQKLNTVKNFMTTYRDDLLNNKINNAEQENRYLSLMEHAKETKSAIAEELTKKQTGIIANLSKINLSDTGIFNTQGMQIVGIETMHALKDLSFDGINLVEQALKVNSSNGKKGIDFAYALAGRAYADRFFNEKYLKDITSSLGVTEEVHNDFKNKLFNNLKTTGTLSLNKREPQEYAGSTNINALFFSDHVQGDTLLVSNTLQEIMKNDNDSDNIDFSILKGEADISYADKDGSIRTITKNIDYATYKTLSNMDNFSVRLHQNTAELFGEAKRSMYIDAATLHPQYYKSDAMKTTKELREQGKGQNHFDMPYMKNFTIGGTDSGDWAETSSRQYTDPKEYQRLSTQYANIEQNFLSSLNDEQQQEYNSSDHAKQRNMIRNWAVNNFKDKDNEYFGQVKDALEFRLNEYDKKRATIIANANKQAAGSSNYVIHKYLRRIGESNVFNGTELSDIMHISTALSESFLSPKNERGSINYRFVDELRNATENIYSAAKSHDQSRIEEAQNNMIDTLNSLLSSRKEKELSKLIPIEGMNSEERIQHAFRTYASLASRVDLSQASDQTESIGTTRNGASQLSVYKNSKVPTQEVLQDINYASEMVTNRSVAKTLNGPIESNISKLDNATPDLIDTINNNVEMPTIEDNIIRDSSKQIENFSRKLSQNFHFKASNFIAGIGAGILLTGYGSTPSTPAETQANGAQEEYDEQYQQQPITFSDMSAQQQSNGAPSYIINISGSSSSGQQEQIVNAINTAINSQIPNNTSINLQINTSFADKISQSQINKMVANSLFN